MPNISTWNFFVELYILTCVGSKTWHSLRASEGLTHGSDKFELMISGLSLISKNWRNKFTKSQLLNIIGVYRENHFAKVDHTATYKIPRNANWPKNCSLKHDKQHIGYIPCHLFLHLGIEYERIENWNNSSYVDIFD